MARVLITGLGCVSALGLGVDRFWAGLVSGESGVRPLSWPAGQEAPRVAVGARVWGYDSLEWFPSDQIPLLDRFSQFAVLAARQAAADSGLDQEAIRSAAVILGTGCGGKETEEQTYSRLYREGRRRVHPLTIPRGMPSAATSQVSIALGAHGPAFSVTSACASSAHAVALAVLLIRSGCAEVALAGGTDAPFTYGLLKAWEALRVLSPDQCRPFSHDRNGLVLGEGAGVVVLESEAHARYRGGEIYAELAGFGLSSDAGHITDPSPNGAAVAMRDALADAGLAPAGIDYINAHGTGTCANDPCETRAIRQVFGSGCRSLGRLVYQGGPRSRYGCERRLGTDRHDSGDPRMGWFRRPLTLLSRVMGATSTTSRTGPRLAGWRLPCPTPSPLADLTRFLPFGACPEFSGASTALAKEEVADCQRRPRPSA